MAIAQTLVRLATADVAPDPTIALGGIVVIAGVFAVAAAVAALLFLIKRSLVAACPVGLSFHPVVPAEYPKLDLESLDRYGRELRNLGFEELSAYGISAERGTVQPGFARLFAHGQHQCFAEVNQLFPTSQEVPMRVVIATRFNQGWTAATTDRTADAAVWILRRPTNCWRSAPGESVAGLLRLHLELCDLIRTGSGARPDGLLTAENWYDAERRNAEIVRDTIQRRNTVRLLWEFFTYKGRTEWLGALKTARSNVRNDYN